MASLSRLSRLSQFNRLIFHNTKNWTRQTFPNARTLLKNEAVLSQLRFSTTSAEPKDDEFHSIIKDTEKPSGEPVKHEFQAETRMLLDIVARSLYSDKEVFVRELISNASDALEKFRYLTLSEEEAAKSIREPNRSLEIHLSTDKQGRTLTIQDTGIGMTKDELISHLGVIARSGSKAFLEQLKSKESTSDSGSNIIGQFGVGFYSAFMVAEKVEVYSRASTEDQGYRWISDGTGSYEIQPAEGVQCGTKIVLHLKVDCREFADEDTIKNIVNKYSNFVGSPIYLNGKKANIVSPLWLSDPKSVTTQQHNEFYRFISGSYDVPRFILHYKTDVPLTINALLYFPEGKPGLFEMSRETESGVALYTRKVLIKNRTDNILPRWCRFVKGVVDSEDIPLNLSRELLQNSALINKLRDVLTGRVVKFLIDQLNKKPEEYEKFYIDYGIFIKEGIITNHIQSEKTVMILSITGGCALVDFCQMQMSHITDCGQYFIIKIPTKRDCNQRTFIVADNPEEEINYMATFRKYYEIRKRITNHTRFLLRYCFGKCCSQPVGRNTFAKIPSQIATFLKLPDPKSYTGRSYKNMPVDVRISRKAAVIRRHFARINKLEPSGEEIFYDEDISEDSNSVDDPLNIEQSKDINQDSFEIIVESLSEGESLPFIKNENDSWENEGLEDYDFHEPINQDPLFSKEDSSALYSEGASFIKKMLSSKERLEDAAKLLLFESSHRESGKKVTLDDYISRIKQEDNSKVIFYLAAPSRSLAEASPYYESLKRKQQEVLFCYEPYDELVLMQLQQFKGYRLVSVEKDMRDDKAANDLTNLGDDSLRRSEINELSDWIKKKLSGRAVDVNATSRLENHPCVVTVEEMAAARHFIRTQSHQLSEDRRYAILQPKFEINPRHPIIKKLHKLMTTNPHLAELLANQLFANSMVGAGLVDDPRILLTSMNDLLVKALEKH